MAWICPDCKRSFGRKNQSHECAPSGTVDDYFEGRPRELRTIYNAVERAITKLGKDVIVDPVHACIMFKRARTFGEVRAMKDRLRLYFILSREILDERIDKRLRMSAHRCVHQIDVTSPKQIDRDVRDWLAEAYACSPM
jgi:predicted transport protein